MKVEECKRRLHLFGVAVGDDENTKKVRDFLATLLATGALELFEVQTIRDIVARRPNAGPFAPAFIACMFLSLHAGNAFFAPSTRAAKLIVNATYDEDEPNATAPNAFAKWWLQNVLPCGDSLAGDVIIKDGARYFFKLNYAAVTDIRRRLADFTNNTTDFTSLQLTPSQLKEVTTFTAANGSVYSLAEDQCRAVSHVAVNRFTVVTGGPGTGKTTVVCSFLRALIGLKSVSPVDIALVAPTGRAAQRMGEAIRKQCAEFASPDDQLRKQIEALNGSTIQALLGGYPPNWKFTADKPLPHKLIIVDESSMVDVKLMQALLSALTPSCRLVLLGDGNQLPSVDAGAVLGDLVAGSLGNSVVKLTTSHRFTGRLKECAEAINLPGDDDTANNTRWNDFLATAKSLTFAPSLNLAHEALSNPNSCCTLPLPDAAPVADCQSLLLNWARGFGLLDTTPNSVLALAQNFSPDDPALTDNINSPAAHELFAALDRSRILTVVRQGAYGVAGVNEFLVRHRFGGRLPADPFAEVGVPVLIMRNTRERNLCNGDIGLTVRSHNGMVALFPRGDKEVVSCPVGLLPEHDLAYAITIHKSQGSEFSNVLVLLPKDPSHPLLSRPLVYTGITRAKNCAIILGTTPSLCHALSTSLPRDTGLL